jgi:hypothetical protein
MAQDQASSEHSRVDLLPAAKSSPDATSDWAPGPATVDLALGSEAAPAALPVLVKPAVPSLQQEIETLLRWRLRWLTLLCGVAILAILPLMPQLWRPLLADPVQFAKHGPLLFRSFVFAAVVLYPPLLILLWSRPRLSVRALRLMEWVFVGTGFAYMAIDLHTDLSKLCHAPVVAGTRWMRQPVIVAQGTTWALTPMPFR